jgi:hypothetical protein
MGLLCSSRSTRSGLESRNNTTDRNTRHMAKHVNSKAAESESRPVSGEANHRFSFVDK